MVTSLITSAIGLILILVAGYVVATGILVTSETVIGAQKEMNVVQIEILGTGITVTSSPPGFDSETGKYNLTLSVENTGDAVISDLDELDIYILVNNEMVRYSGASIIPSPPVIAPDTINPRFLDPDETLTITIEDIDGTPEWAKVTTPNGISASAYTPE